MDKEPLSALASCLHEAGLPETEYWLSQLKEKGIISKASLKSFEGNIEMYSMLVYQAKSDLDRRGVQKLLKIDYAKGQSLLKQGNAIEHAQISSKYEPQSNYTFDDDEFILKCSGGLALQGILLTSKLEDQVETRSSLLELPKKISWTREIKCENTLKIHLSSAQDNLFKKAMEVLGCGIISSNAPVYESANITGRKDQELEKRMQKTENYVSTLKYISAHAAACSFDIKELRLSEDARLTLKSDFQDQDIKDQMQTTCELFFKKYGSHVSIGPLKFGGHILWECSSIKFGESEKYNILKIQSSAIALAENDFLIEMNDIIKKACRDVCSEETSESIHIARAIAGGASKVASLSQWTSYLKSHSNTWVLTDRGKKLVAVWDIIEINHEEELGEIREILKSAWEKMSGLKAADSNILANELWDGDHVLAQISEWNKERTETCVVIQQRLHYLLEVKKHIKTPKLWTSKYLSYPPVQDFLNSIMMLKTDPPTLDHIQTVMREIVELKELNELIEQGISNIKDISTWLYYGSAPQLNLSYLLQDNYDFPTFIDSLKQIIDEEKENPETFPEMLTKKVDVAINKLRSRYQQSYEDILIIILVYPFCHMNDDVITLKPLSILDVKNLLKTFVHELQAFNEHRKTSLLLQSKLLSLAISVSKQQPLKSLFKEVTKMMKKMEIWSPLEKQLRFLLNDYSENLIKLKACLDSLIDQEYKKESKKSTSSLSKNAKAIAILELLGLDSTKKLQFRDALCIRQKVTEISLNEDHCSDPKQLPYLILQKLMSYDSLCRSDLMAKSVSDESDSDDYVDSDDENTISHSTTSKGIHPVDGILAVLICSDDILRQDLISRLAKCQLAIPFVIPNPINEQLILPIWAMQSVIKEWTTEQKFQHSHPLVTYPMAIISILRFGNQTNNNISKSQILNEVISDEDISYYFHRNCRGGQYRRVLGEGLVDMTWYIPSGQKADIFPDPITFLNLHGNAHEHPHQTDFLCKISSLCLVVLVDKDFIFEGEDKAFLAALYASEGGLTLLNACSQQPKILKKEFPKSHVIDVMTKKGAELKDTIRKRILRKIKNTEKFRSIEDLCEERNECIILDEDREDYKNGYLRASKLTKLIPLKGRIKESTLPLQGKQLWQLWASYDKELNRQTKRGSYTVDDYSAKIENIQSDIRLKQLRHIKVLSPVMTVFITSLLYFGDRSHRDSRNYFLHCLKLKLNNLSRENINNQQQQYHTLRKDLSKHLADQSISTENKMKMQKQLQDLQQDIMESSFGLEHLLREVGQVYEAAKESGMYNDLCSQISKAVAELLIEGYPLELMDGDSSHVPIRWVKAVLTDMTKILGDQKVFVLSVLGLQSTGKSTMLNATFGLQFNVSAGRCTRGAFMQLLTLDDELKTSTGLSYVLVVDTEGLRAPEHDSQTSQKHDNELATFVIGLANMTLINIYGEVPGDMDDILQTSVHAFLRMTQVKCHPSCQFVHQNASINIKGEVGSSKFTQKLNKFTVDAAKEEHCEGQYESFNDVIKFDDETDVHYFPGLWKGNPPLAPINLGYSHTAQDLKLNFIKKILKRTSQDDQSISVCGLNLSSFTIRLTDLWEALLKEKFVFSFKNTLEITAYRSLEIEYGKWDWDFQVAMLDWKKKADNEINSAPLAKVYEIVEKKVNELQINVLEKYNALQSEMEAFFNGKQSEILVQWKKNFEIRLKNLSEELKMQGEEHCKKLHRRRHAISEFEVRKQSAVESIKQKVQENIEAIKEEQKKLQENLENRQLDSSQLIKLLERDLFTSEKLSKYTSYGITKEVIDKIIHLKDDSNGKLTVSTLEKILVDILTVEQMKKILKNSLHTEEELKKEFDVIWKELVGQISHYESKKYTEVDSEVENALCKYARTGGCEGDLISKIKKIGLKKWTNEPVFKVTENVHFSKTCGTLVQGKNYLAMILQGADRFQIKATDITHQVIFEAQQCVEEIIQRGTDFTVTYVQELLQHTDKVIKDCCSNVTEYEISFTTEYKIEMYGRACSYAIPKFQRMAKFFEDQNNPLFYLEQEKAPLFTKYKNQYKQTETEEAIADTLCAYLENPLKKQVKKNLGTKLVNKMKMSKDSMANKLAFKVKILLDLKEEGDFFGFMAYIRQMIKFMTERIKFYTIEFADQKCSESEKSELQYIAQNEVTRLVGIIKDAIYKAKKDDIDMPKWLQLFCRDHNFPSELGIKLKARDILVGYESLQHQNLNNLIEKLSQHLKDLEIRMIKVFDKVKCESVIDQWKDQLGKLYKLLIGCTAQCPFCGEQCDLLRHDKSRLHRTEIHRIDCIAGWRYKDTLVLSTGFCPSLVAGGESFYKANKELQAYKQYRSVYPDWSIPPNVTSKCTMYWKWFVGKYHEHLAAEYHVEPANVPVQWSKYDWNAVKEDLLNIYNL